MRDNNYSEKIVFASSQNFKERDYWLKKLSGKLVKSIFPRDVKKITFNKPQKMEAVHFRFSGELFAKLMKLSNNSDYRLHIVIVTGIAALLHKYTGSEDILVGIPTYKQDVAGELINTVLVVRNQVKLGMTFKELLLQVGQTVLEADQNQNYPIETLLYKLNLPVLANDFPLFDAAILLENIHDKSYLRHVNPNMIFSFLRTNEHIETVIEYNRLLFDKSTIEIIINHFLELLHQAFIDINRPLPIMNIVSEKEKKQLLIDFNDNNAGFSKDKTICHFIEKYADITPGQTAILFEGTEVSYRTLNQRANRLARVLKERGIQADEPISILLNRSPRMAESMLAVWKAGGAYIPMDPDYPPKRINEILADSNAKVLLTGTDVIKEELVKACSDKILDLDIHADGIEKQDASNHDLNINMNSLAYIIYTSGSTGKPKGVMVEHIGMMNHICAKINDLHLSEKSVVAQNASHTFDISVWQFFVALTLGGKTVIYPNELVLESVRFIDRVNKDRVTILEVVPSYLSAMLETLKPGDLRTLDYLIVTGEALKPDLVTRWFTKFPHIKMVNAYGPTEASDDITHHIMDKPPEVDRVPIGKPVQNFNITIVDENTQICPLRIKGEICVSGIGVGRGYLNNPELTAEKFDYDLWDYQDYHDGYHRSHRSYRSYIYRTGDLGSWLPDGTIEFFGRKDYQVKIRGFRIELGEIETQLETHSHVKEAVVVDREEKNGNKYLCAYLVMLETLNVSEIKAFLAERLPDYMVPTHMMELKKMPLTPNGKIDRSALPEPVGETAASIPYITEKMLKSVEIPSIEKTGGIAGPIGEELVLNEKDRLTREDKQRLLYSFNDTEIDYSNDKTLHRLFEEQVERSPDAVSVVYEDRGITYKELNYQANRLARWFRTRGLEKQDIVGLLMDRSIEMMEAIFAVLKAGGTYMPLEMDTPKDRMISLLEDTQASMLLTSYQNIKPYDPYGFIKLQNLQRIKVKPYITPSRPQITQLDTLPFPDRSLADYEKYSKYIGQAMVKNSMALQGTRGCPFKCTFCHKLWPKTHLVRSAENLVEEIKRLRDLGVRRFSFVDDVFNFNKTNSSRFFQLIIENNLDVQLFFSNGMRGDILTTDYIDLMVRAGVVSVGLALETASPRLQKFVGKNLNIEKLRENLEYICNKYPQVILEMYHMHGFPTETPEECRMTLAFLKRLHWVHFPYLAILKVYPKTDMEKIALKHGISQEAINSSAHLAGHELPETLPFDKQFTMKFQTQFLQEYFLVKERLLHVLPYQMKILTEDEIVQKYNSYLPVQIKSLDDLLKFVNISVDELEVRGFTGCMDEDHFVVPHLNLKLQQEFPAEKPAPNALKVLLLDLSLYFMADRGDMLYDIPSPPLGLMYLMTYLKREYGSRVEGRIAKSRMDFDSYDELKNLIKSFKPDIIGLRTLTFFKNFFHEAIAMIRSWGVDVPIITGGPYATSEFESILQDRNIDVVVLGEGEVTFGELIGKIMENEGRLPGEEVLKDIPGLAFITGKSGKASQLARDIILLEPHSFGALSLPVAAPAYADANLPPLAKPSDLAYVIFTSGSTGKPKGVMIENRPVLNFIKGMTDIIDFTANDVILSLITISFDIFVLEALLPLTVGCKVVIGSMEQQLDTRATSRVLNREQITIFQGTPSMVQWLIADHRSGQGLTGLKYLLVGGEIFPESLLEKLRKIVKGKIINLYGPTETTVWSTSKDVSDHQALNIGKPIANTQIYILGRTGVVQPIGVTGELWIGGHGVARGYLNRPELTHEKFSRDLWDYLDYHDEKNKNKGPDKRNYMSHRSQRSHISYKSYIYNTGDLARWQPDGNIEFLGRMDHQVKIRGLRIELGEIENLLLEYRWIDKTAVVVKEHIHKKGSADDDGDKYLYAYFVTSKPVTEGELRMYLSGKLPPYMIPTGFGQLEMMPLTTSGKINRRLLEALDIRIGKEVKKQGPTDAIEQGMIKMWSDILGMDESNIGIDDNFFELGGHSLKMTVLVARIHKEFNVNIPLVDIFNTPTIKELSHYIRNAVQDKHTSIIAVEKKEYYPLSSAQKRLYVLQQMELASISYNMPGVFLLEGEIEKENVEQAFRQLINRHESLRTSFILTADEPVQRIHDEVAFAIEYDEAIEEEVNSILETSIRPFNLSQAPLLRFGLIRIGKSKHIVMLDLHHIICDGVSDHIFVGDLLALLKDETLPGLRLQYKDFSQWQNRLIDSGKLKQQEEYWQKIFTPDIPVLNLPTDYGRPGFQDFTGSGLSFILGHDETAALKELELKEGVTLFMVLLSVFGILLAKLSGQEDIVIGTPIGGRRHADLENIIGMFVNTLALRITPAGTRTFKAFLPEVKNQVLQAYENQDYQFEDLVEKVAINRDPSRNPLFDVMFAHQNVPIANVEISALKLNPYQYDTHITKFDLILNSEELEQRIALSFGYSTKLFKSETIKRFIGYFQKIVTAILQEPGKQISTIEILSEKEKHQLLYGFNETRAGYPENKTIHQLFEEQVERTPDNIAVVGPAERTNRNYMAYISYRQLNRKAHQLACLLREKGVCPDTIGGIMVERSIEMITGMLGILKAGGAYLPLDPKYPEERINYMLKDSNAGVLVTTPKLQVKIKANVKLISLASPLKPTSSTLTSTCQVSPGNLAYIIYTSGTTGKPKGTLIQHHNVLQLMVSEPLRFDFNSSDVWTMFHSYSFDFSVWEMYGALLYGGKLVVIPAGVSKDTERFLEILKEEAVTVLNQTPSAFYNLTMKELEKPDKQLRLRYVIFGGEALKPLKLKEWKEKYPGTKLINMFGITETTVHVTFKEIGEEDIERDISNIGKPIPTLSTYIMDRDGNILPLGVQGELCVGGDGVGRGYLNRPELTGEKFTGNDYKPGERIYRSGDMVRFFHNGEMEYLGRLDHQVKIRGFRIEAGEIETLLLKHNNIKDAVVITREGTGARSPGNINGHSGDRYLCAYIVPHSMEPGEDIGAPQLKEYLSRHLADYMIPTHFVRLEKIPLTVNGKVDRNALPVPEVKSEAEYAAPRNALEEQLAAIWAKVLGLEKGIIGIDGNFFQLGGHSLTATLLTTKIHKALDVKVPLREIFLSPTIRGFARYIKEAKKDKYASLETVEKMEYYPLSSAQKRLYFLWQLETQDLSYNMPQVFLLEGELKRERFENTLKKMTAEHESFRTSFEMIDDTPVQKIYPFNELAFSVADYKSKKDEANPIIGDFIRPFDLARAPLFRVGLIEIEARRQILMVDMHHIIGDGNSMILFVKDFIRLYEGNDLPPLRVQYKDYSQWLNREMGGQEIAKQEMYWSAVFAGEIPVLNLPLDYARPMMRSSEGNALGFEIGPEETQTLKKLALNENATLYMVLLALFNILLLKLSGQEDIVVGTPVEGRRYADLEPIFGMFVNTLAIRNYPERRQTFNAFLKGLKENTLAAFENQEYQFEDLVDRVNIKKDTSRNPLFDVMFQLNVNDAPAGQIPGLKLQPYGNFHPFSKFDISLKGVEAANRLSFSLEYCTKLFKKETIELLIRDFKQVVSAAGEDPEKKLYQMVKPSPEKRKEILAQFNREFDNTPAAPSVQEKLANSFQKHGHHTAIEYGSRAFTYAALDRRCHDIARLIMSKAIKKQTFIGILLDDRLDFIAAVIGILKAACVFVPLDTDYPDDRLKMMVRHTEIGFIICDTVNFIRLTAGDFVRDQAQHDPEFIIIDDLSPQTGDSPAVQYSPGDKIYVYFTSGTTGTPKAFIGKNQGLMDFVHWEIETFNITNDYRVSQLTTPVFDAFLRDVFVPLWAGGVICIPGYKEISIDSESLIKWLDQSGIHLIHCVPGLFRLINSNTLRKDHFKNLKFVLLSGERINPSDLVQWYETFAERIQLVNLWGTSETTLAKTIYFIRPSDIHLERIPVGKPMESARVIILDDGMEVCDDLVTGEIYILTPSRTLGYCNEPGLNHQQFIRNPFNDKSHDLMHRTGDLGRFLPDGNIDLLGRNDRQVKIRGIRVELEEIESLMARHALVNEAIVVKREISEGNELLCAYVVLKNSGEGDVKQESLLMELEGYLTGKLPAYMVPASIMIIKTLPRTSRGKVNYDALPDPLAQNRASHVPPRDELEKSLCSLWSEILRIDIEKISVTNSFFELGGHSLNAMVLVSKIHKVFNVKFPLAGIFAKITIQQQAEFIKHAERQRHVSLKPVEEREYYPLSSAQMRVYILHQMRSENMIYNMPRIQILEGEIDKERMEDTFINLIKRHESFRTSFLTIAGTPVQRIHKDVNFGMDYFEADEKEADEIVDRYLKPFDISQAPILRVALIRIENTKHILIVEMHHIISDGTSLTIFVKDIMQLYRGNRLSPLRIRYRDFSQWRNSPGEQAALKGSEKFWLKEFAREIPVLKMPTDYPRPVLRRFDGDQTNFIIDEEESRKLKSIAIKEEATIYMVLLAIFNILLAKVSGQEDFVIGTGIEGRNHEDLRNIIGMFVNALCMRNYPESHKTFNEFLREIRARALAAFENQDYQFEDLVEKVVVNRNTSRNPLHDLIFQVENIETPTVEVSKLRVLPYDLEEKFSKFDITLRAFEIEDFLFFTVEYSTCLFKKETIQRLMIYFRHIAAVVGRDPSTRLSDIDIFPGEEKQHLLFHLNDQLDNEINTINCKPYNTIQARSNNSLRSGKDRIAIAYGNRYLSYAQLDKRSNDMAHGLIRRGTAKQTFIGVVSDDRMELVTALLAILKVGGVFIPLEPDQPQARLRMMIRSTNLQYVLSNKVEFFQKLESPYQGDNEPEFILIEELYARSKGKKADERPAIQYGSRDQIYVYFTSGTSGTPRAMVGKNRSLLHFIDWEIETFGINKDYRISQLITPDFDAFLRDIFAPLCSGGVICIPPGKETLMDAVALVQWVQRTGIHLIHCVPSVFRLFNPSRLSHRDFKDLKYILLSGERLNPADLVQWYETFDQRIQLVNLWGPTEATLVKSCYFVQKSDAYAERVQVGLPMKGARVAIMDSGMKACPPLVVGELYLLTPFSTFGYCNEPELTHQRFLSHPDIHIQGLRMYKTGDWGRILTDGNLEVLGRKDRQVKIRGIRIELEEIESLMVKHPLVKEAVVVTQELTADNKRLCAYAAMTASAEDEIGKDMLLKELENNLAAKLPDYMVPAVIMIVETIPRTPRGKIDYDQLPDPLYEEKTKFVAPRDDTEMKLLHIWTDMLNVEKIGVTNNFFDMGGNSLNIMSVITKIHRDFQVKFPLADIFNNPTIEEQAAFIKEAKKDEHISLPMVEEKEYYALSSAQKRIYFLYQMDPGSRVYNVTRVIVLEGTLHKERIEETFLKLIRRHESFRTSFEVVEGQPLQRIHRHFPFGIDYFEAEEKEADGIVKRYLRPFDLTRPPILRVGLIKIGQKLHILMVEMHHIIADGVSMVLLVNDFMALSREAKLPSLRIRYKDFSEWRNSEREKKKLQEQETYWLKEFEEMPLPLNLSTDYTRPAVMSFEGNTLAFHISEEETEKLKTLALNEGATIYILLLAICNIFLAKLSGQEDIVIGTGIEGRQHEDLRQIIGMFVNTLALRNYPRQEKTFLFFLREVRERTLKAFENQDYQFEDLVDKVAPQRDTNRNPLFDLDFQVENIQTSKPGVSAVKIKDYGYKRKIARFDLTLRAFEIGDRLHFTLEYRTKLFKEETIQWLIRCYKDITLTVIENPGIKLARIGMMAKEEKETILPQLMENLENE